MRVPCSLRPRRDLCARPLPHFGVAFRHSNGVGSRNETISGLNHTARTLAVYASQGGLLHRHARLASGWLAKPLPGGVGYPLGSNERFQVIAILLSQALPGALLSMSSTTRRGESIASALATSSRLIRVRPARFSGCASSSVSNDCKREVNAAPRSQILLEDEPEGRVLGKPLGIAEAVILPI